MAPPPGLLGPPSIHRPALPSSGGKLNDQSQPENPTPTPKPSQNPCLDLIFSDPRISSLTDRLEKSWTHNPMTTLKIIFRLRSVGVTGTKSDDEDFYMAMHWLHQNHPLTLACNVRVFASFGYMKDLFKILRRVLEDEEVDIEGNKIKKEREQERYYNWWERRRSIKEEKREKENPSVLRRKKSIARAKKAVDRFAHDGKYRFLHNQISEFIAELLRSDLRFLESGETEKISLASKWCPSINSLHDRSTLICENIARKLFPKSDDDDYRCLEDFHYAYRVRDRLRKQVLIPLRKALDSANRVVPPKRVGTKEDDKGSRVSKKAKPRLRLRCFPHKIVASLKGTGQFGSMFAQLQWWKLIQYLSKKRDLSNCLAICTFSESMKAVLMDFSFAMGLLISELSQKPWKGRVLAFGSNPKLLNIKGDDLKSKLEFMRQLRCDNNLKFSKLFDQVLKFAVKRKLSQDKMVKRIFVFSDGGYYGGGVSSEILESYRRRGYAELPEIVFWNLSSGVKSLSRREGSVDVNGFSERLVSKLLLKEVEVPRRKEVMESAISTDGEFRDLIVLD